VLKLRRPDDVNDPQVALAASGDSQRVAKMVVYSLTLQLR
jgi:hypothetical protein